MAMCMAPMGMIIKRWIARMKKPAQWPAFFHHVLGQGRSVEIMASNAANTLAPL